jgi:hypothetical protein
MSEQEPPVWYPIIDVAVGRALEKVNATPEGEDFDPHFTFTTELKLAFDTLLPPKLAETAEIVVKPIEPATLPLSTRLLLLLADCESGHFVPMIDGLPIGHDKRPRAGKVRFAVGGWTLTVEYGQIVEPPRTEIRWTQVTNVRTPEGIDRSVDDYPWLQQYRPQPATDRFTALVEMYFREALAMAGDAPSRVPIFSVVDPKDGRTYKWVKGSLVLWKDARGREV